MAFLIDFWLPILLSAVGVFIASSIMHMVIPMHCADHKGLSGEEEIMDAIRSQKNAPGTYVFPFAKDMKEYGSDAMIEKFQRGPVGMITLRPTGSLNMG
ncbi:MAG: hypothetical protein KDB61_03160, partial [Planctomycetes bacterium]|nr:hypothetical protein [Planctomycetota bacterium]